VISVGSDITEDLEKNSVFFTQLNDGTVLSVYAAQLSSAWGNVVKKGLVSNLQVFQNTGPERTYSRSAVDVSGVHLTNYVHLDDGTIEGNYDQSMYLSGLPEDVKVRGCSHHRLGLGGYLVGVSLSHSVHHYEGQPQHYEGTDPGSFLDKNSVIVSDGYLLMNFLSEVRGPEVMANIMPRTMAEIMENMVGFVASSLSDTNAEQAVREVETKQLDDLLEGVSLLMEAILQNPNKLKEKALYTIAHRLRHFIDHHPVAGEVVKKRVQEGRTENNAKWVDFILAPEPKKTESAPLETVSVTPTADDPNYPYNKAKDWNERIGGSDFNLFAQAGYFAGTNFDCKHSGINYKLKAYVKGGCHLFKHEEEFFSAEAVYATINGATVEDHLGAKLFGRTIKDEQLLPVIPGCPPEVVKNIANVSPGFHVSYTIVVVVIPVTFSAGVTANIYLKWGYQLCPQNLQAHVDLRPGITVTASASATASIAVAKGGIELSGSVNFELRPTAMVDGGLCQFGVNLHRIQAPAQIKFDGWYQTWGCSIHHWKPHCGYGSRHEHVFWHWDGKPVDQPLWGELCQATLHPFSFACHEQKF